jgi:hypothetical protein
MPCNTPCQVGYWETSGCTDTSNRICAPILNCSEACPEGTYEAEACSALSAKQCIPCVQCAPGEYFEKPCSNYHPGSCAQCTTVCPLGTDTNIISGNCLMGTTHSDVVECLKTETSLRSSTTDAGYYRTNANVEYYGASIIPSASQDIIEISGINDIAMIRHKVDPARGTSQGWVLTYDGTVYAGTIFQNIVKPTHVIFQTLLVNNGGKLLVMYGSENTTDITQNKMFIKMCSITDGVTINGADCTEQHTHTQAVHAGCTETPEQQIWCAYNTLHGTDILQIYPVSNASNVVIANHTVVATITSDTTNNINNTVWCLTKSHVGATLRLTKILDAQASIVWQIQDTSSLIAQKLLSTLNTTQSHPRLLFVPYTNDLILGIPNSTEIHVWGAFSTATTPVVRQTTSAYTAIGVVGAKLMIAVNNVVYMHIHVAKCPAESTCPPGASSITQCVCPPGKYGTFQLGDTEAETISIECKSCAQTCPVDTYKDILACDSMEIRTSDKTCVPCQTTCSPGYYLRGRCDGAGFNDTTICTPCQYDGTCNNGTFMASRCSGATFTDVSACPACTTQCRKGYRLHGQCPGNTTHNAVTCVPCKNCGLNQYYALNCDGSTEQDVQVTNSKG